MKRLISFVVGFLLAFPVLANEVIGNAVAVIGTVSVQRAATGELETLTRNGDVFLNDVIKTGSDGLAKLLLADESILKVSPNTELQISSMIAGPGENGRSTVDLLKGRIRSVIGNKLGANSEFNVNTPVAVAGVRGTDFEVVHVLVDGEWVTGVRCYDGAVALSSQTVLASAGDIIILPKQYSLARGTQQPSAPEELPEDQTLYDILGVPDPDADLDTDGVRGDAVLDGTEIQNILLNLSTDPTMTIDRLLEQISTYDNRTESTSGSNTDVQLNTITAPLNGGAQLNFDIEIPLPN